MKKSEILNKYNISDATLHNWKKLNYLKSITDIDPEEIDRILEYKTGNRRNKKISTKSIIHQSYVNDKNIVKIIEKILAIKDSYDATLNEVLYEVIIKVLNSYHLDEPCEVFDILGKRSSNKEFINAFKRLKIKYANDNDFLGCLYMSLLSIGKKDKDGIFYTPYNVVNRIIESVNLKKNLKIVDPSCGSGNFLIQVFKELKRKRVKTEDIISNLYGFDIDPIAVLLAKINIYLLDKKICYDNINIYCIDFLNDDFDYRFDIVIGNPPWGKKYTPADRKKLKNRYDLEFSKLDSFAQFIIKAFTILNDNGSLSFVLPSSILNIQTHEKIRKFLLQYKLEYVKKIGREFVEVVTDVVLIKAIKDSGKNNTCKYDDKEISQDSFYKNSYSSFLISDGTSVSIISKLKEFNCFHLDDNVNYALGVVTGDNKKYLYTERLENSEPILSGKEIDKYNIDYSKIKYYIEFDKSKLQQVAKEEYYRCENKIIYKFIGKRLCFSVERNGVLTLNSANVICLDECYDIYYISAILNSRITQLYFDECYDTHKVLKNHIKSFYIPKFEQEICDIISKIAKDAKPSNMYNEKIEEIIYSNLGLTGEEIGYLKGRYN